MILTELRTYCWETVAGGPYDYTLGTLSAGPQYDLILDSSRTFAITPRDITITADPKSKIYGEIDPILTYQITSGSLVVGDAFSGS